MDVFFINEFLFTNHKYSKENLKMSRYPRILINYILFSIITYIKNNDRLHT